MKKLKVFMFVALFGAMSFGAFSAYDYLTMNADEMALLENIEALTEAEGAVGDTEGYDVNFTFNGQSWNGSYESGSSRFFPNYIYCYYNAKSGHQVECVSGSGNCWNGTGCI